jgi:3-methylcrotonyl-CoA carboxylase alpha subunit
VCSSDLPTVFSLSSPQFFSFSFSSKFLEQVSGRLYAADGTTEVNIEAEVDGHRMRATAAQFKGALHLHLADAAVSGRHMHVFDLEKPSIAVDDGANALPGISAEMPGKVVKMLVEEGDMVEKGAPVVILEAMKMEHTLCAPFSGTVGDVFAGTGDFVDANVDIVIISQSEE